MRLVPIIGEFKPILKYVVLKIKEKEENENEESDEEDLLRKSKPREIIKLTEEEDKEF